MLKYILFNAWIAYQVKNVQSAGEKKKKEMREKQRERAII